ncbi:hypothetical protein [Burkholderia ambifaria]|nr:hypothetical protein [Burkholderia ambifaria]
MRASRKFGVVPSNIIASMLASHRAIVFARFAFQATRRASCAHDRVTGG